MAADGGRFARNAYPTVAALPDGRLFLTWSAYDATKPRVVGAFSSDGGKTWGTPETLIETPGLGDHDPNIIVTNDEIQVYSTTAPVPQPRIERSETWKTTRPLRGSAWTKPVRIPQHRKYLVGKIHVGVRLADGTLLMPYSWDIPAEEGRPATSEAGMNLSGSPAFNRRRPDLGPGWRHVRRPAPQIRFRRRRRGWSPRWRCSPTATFMRCYGHGRLAVRAAAGTAPGPGRAAAVEARAHNTPAALWRLRDSRDVLAVWDNSSSHRWPLAVAISRDDCVLVNPKTLTNPVGTQASYPSATTTSDGTLIAVWQRQDRPERKGRDLWIARFSRAWVME
jgi:hypothetical protein